MMISPADNRSFTYRIDSKNRICFVSQEWLDFAQENAAPELTLDAVIDQPIERFITDWDVLSIFDLIYSRVRKTGNPVVLPFRCDTPTRRRFMELSLSLLEGGDIEFIGRVLAIEERNSVPILDAAAPRSHDLVTICSWCKRIKTENDLYVEVEHALAAHGLFGAKTPRLTHGVCPDCFDRIRREIGL